MVMVATAVFGGHQQDRKSIVCGTVEPSIVGVSDGWISYQERATPHFSIGGRQTEVACPISLTHG